MCRARLKNAWHEIYGFCQTRFNSNPRLGGLWLELEIIGVLFNMVPLVIIILTGNNGAPFTQTLSANRTRLGRDRSFARLPADNNVDFRPEQLLMAGWHTNKLT